MIDSRIAHASTPPTRHAVGRALFIALLPLILFGAALAAFLLFNRADDARSTITLGVDQKAPVASLGQGKLTPAGYEVTVSTDGGVAVAVWPSVPEDLGARPIIRCECIALRPDADLRLIWRRDDRPNILFSARIEHELATTRPLDLSTNPNWTGRITGIGVAMRGYAGDLLQVRGITAHRAGTAARIASLVDDWQSKRPWDGQSINLIIVGSPDRALSPVVVVAILAAIGLLLLSRTRPSTRAATGIALCLGAVAWIALDLRWQLDLVSKVSKTLHEYGTGSIEERWRAAPDGDIYMLATAVKHKASGSGERAFVFGDEPYTRGRAAYHLLPLPVYYDAVAGTLPDGKALRPGDFVLMLWTRQVRFDTQASRLVWENGNVHVAPLASVHGMTAFQVEP